jgi:hypothetical protein
LPGEPKHIAIVVFDPYAQLFSSYQLDQNRALLLSQLLQIGRFFIRGFWRSALRLSRTAVRERHR